MKNWSIANWVFLILVLGGLTFFSFNPINQQDPGYLLKTGEYILQHRVIPHTDVFSLTAYGAPWVVHYWLAAVVFQLLYSWGGAAFTITFVSLVALITFILIFATARQRTKNLVLSLVLMSVSFLLLYRFWVVRDQIFSYLFTAILLYILERAWSGGRYRPLYILPILFVLWANFHAGVVLGVAILWLFAITFILRRHGLSRPDKLSMKIILITLVSSVAVLINPNGYIIYIYSFMIAPVAAALRNSEWISLLSYAYWNFKIFLAGMVIVALFILYRAAVKYRRNREVDLFHLGLLVGAFLMPIISVRQMIFFAIIVLPILSAELEEFANERGVDLNKYLQPNLIWLVLAAATFIWGLRMVVLTFKGGLVDASALPVKAVDFIQKEGIRGPYFNIEYGGYLIWRLYPKERVFRDGRDEVYRGKPLEEFLTVTAGKPGWKELVDDKYKINYFILWYPPPLFGPSGGIAERITKELGFELVYWDNNTVIFVRDTPQNKKVINEFAYKYVSPFINPAGIPITDLKKAEDEIYRAISGDPDSPELQGYFFDVEKRLNPDLAPSG